MVPENHPGLQWNIVLIYIWFYNVKLGVSDF